MDAQCGETSFYVFSACIYCTAGLITVGSLSFCCKLLNKNYFQKKKTYEGSKDSGVGKGIIYDGNIMPKQKVHDMIM